MGASNQAKVVIVFCPDSEFDEIGETADFREERLLSSFKDIADLRKQLLVSPLRLDPKQFVVRCHPPGNCDSFLFKSHLEMETYEDRDEAGTPIISAHIQPKDRQTSGICTTSTRTAQTALPKALNEQKQKPQPATTAKTETLAKTARKASGVRKSKRPSKATTTSSAKAAAEVARRTEWSKKSLDELFVCVRLGTTKEFKKEKLKSNIQRELWLVAVVPKAIDSDESDISYLEVDTENVGEVQIGHYEESDDRSFLEVHDLYQLDPAFVFLKNTKDMAEMLYEIAHDTADYLLVKSFSDNPIKETGEFEMILAPRIPTYAGPEDEPTILQKYRQARNVSALVYFKNRIAEHLKPKDFQVLQSDFKHSESYADIHDYVMNGDGDSFKGLKKHPKLSRLKTGFRIELWILPHIKDSCTLYSWTNLNDWKVCHWLSDDVVKRSGRADLYVEVHILPRYEDEDRYDDEGEGIGPLELDDMMARDGLLAAVEGVDSDELSEEDSAGTIVVGDATKSKKVSAKRPASDDSDEADDDQESKTSGKSKKKKGKARRL